MMAEIKFEEFEFTVPGESQGENTISFGCGCGGVCIGFGCVGTVTS
jgi:hypothetical protein